MVRTSIGEKPLTSSYQLNFPSEPTDLIMEDLFDRDILKQID